MVPGLVLYDGGGRPIYGSNPRNFIRKGSLRGGPFAGVIRFEARDLPVVEGTYLLSLWLGDWHKNYDHKEHVLSLVFHPRTRPRGVRLKRTAH